MLKTYLNTIPYTKFVLVEDTIETKDDKLFDYLIRRNKDKTQYKVHYFVYEGVFEKTRQKYIDQLNIIFYDCVSNVENWGADGNLPKKLDDKLSKLTQPDILIFDALANIIFQYGISETYKIFNSLKNNKGIRQIIVKLHKDLIEGDSVTTCKFFENLSTLSINIEPKFMSDNKRLQYVYKKSGGRVIHETEEYKFCDNNLVTTKIEKPDPKKILQSSIPKEINPENLSTFKIGLTDVEKLLRDQVILPYLPEANVNETHEGKIFYQLEDTDDWDEEDPDDDLDI